MITGLGKWSLSHHTWIFNSVAVLGTLCESSVQGDDGTICALFWWKLCHSRKGRTCLRHT